MRGWRNGLRKDAWLWAVIAVGLMSGVTSSFREWISLFYPHAVNSGKLFDACLHTCLFLAAIVVVVRQRLTIASLESKADQSAVDKAEAKRLHDLFGEFMSEGESLACELRQGIGNYGLWLAKRNDWIARVSQTLVKMNLPTEAATFRHAGEKDFIPPPGTVFDKKHQFEFYMSQLAGSRTELQEIVKRRLPSL